MKGAHADLSSAAWQEIGVKPGFGLSGIPQHSTRPLLCRPTGATCPGVPWKPSGEPALSEVEEDLRFLLQPQTAVYAQNLTGDEVRSTSEE
jgi:hypothetical protein